MYVSDNHGAGGAVGADGCTTAGARSDHLGAERRTGSAEGAGSPRTRFSGLQPPSQGEYYYYLPYNLLRNFDAVCDVYRPFTLNPQPKPPKSISAATDYNFTRNYVIASQSSFQN